MDNLDAKLVAERARIVALLSRIAKALGKLPPEELAEILPVAVGVDELVRRLALFGMWVDDSYAEVSPNGGASLTGPLGGASLLCY